MKFNNTKSYFWIKLSKQVHLFIFLVSLISLKCDLLKAEYPSEEFQMDNTTKSQQDGSAIPTNPFEIVEMIRRYNSLNDATNPSDAIDEALNSFNSLEEK